MSADLFLHRGSELKIGDLGLSKQILAGIAGAQKHTQCGSPVYLAPEVHMSQAYDGKVDIWAAGCTLYEVMMLRRAFTGDDMEEILAKVVYAVRAPRRRRRHREAAADPAAPSPPPQQHGPIFGDWTAELEELLLAMLRMRTKERPTARELLTSAHLAPAVATIDPQALAHVVRAAPPPPPPTRRVVVARRVG